MVANITPLPPAPVRGSTESTFSAAANLFVAALPTLVTEINTAGDDMELAVTAAQLAETNAETAETNAETAQAAAESARDLAYASSNFKGLWSSLVGALAKPASVAHNDLVWLLLNNLADVTASEPSTANADWLIAAAPPTSVSLDVTANSNGITAGNVVELTSTGGQNVQNIYHCEAPTISSLATLDGTNNVDALHLRTLSSTAAVCYSRLSSSGVPYLRLITSGNPPTQSLVTSVSTNGATATDLSMDVLTSNTVALTYGTIASTNGYTRIATFNSTNITFSTESTAFARTSTVQTATCALTTSNWFVAYADTNSDCQIRTAVSNGTNAPTLGTALNVNGTNNANYLSLARTSDTTAMLVIQNSSDSNGEIAHITGGTTNAPTASTLAHLDGTNNCTYITQSPIDSNHTLCAYNNATTKNGMLAVIQANGTNAPTVVGRAVFSVGDVDSCSLSAHSASLYSLTYGDVSNDGKHIAINIDSNYNLTFSQSVGLQGTNDVAYNAVAALTPTTAICAFRGSGSDGFAGTLTLTPTPVISGQLVGIASTSATNGAAASVDVGPLVTGTYTSGTDYYAAGAGGLTTTATPVHVGKAKSTTELVLDLRGAPEAGKQQVWEITTPGAFTFTVPEDGEYEIVLVGAGGGGANTSGSSMVVCGANAGNGFTKRTYLSAGSVLTGSLGAGGAKSTINASDATGGGDSTIVVFGKTYTIRGGKPAFYQGTNTVLSGNIGNDGGEENIPGQTGSACMYSGGTVYISSGHSILSFGTLGVRGNGGVCALGSEAASAGGDGVVRIALVHGRGK